MCVCFTTSLNGEVKGLCICAANTIALACLVGRLVSCILKMFIYSEVLKNMSSRVRCVEGEFTEPLYLSCPILKWA